MKVKFKNFMIISTVSIMTLFSSGCNNGEKLNEAAEKAKKNESVPKNEQEIIENSIGIWEDYYNSYNKTVENAIEEMEKEDVITAYTNVVIKDRYESPNELAAYTSKILYDFYKMTVNPESFLVFINKFGTDNMKSLYFTNDSESDLTLVENLQTVIHEQGINYLKYDLSTLKLSEDQQKASFYRRVQMSTGSYIYFETTLIKQDGYWYLDSDEKAVPVNFVPNAN